MESDLIKSKLAHLEEVKKKGIDPYPHAFQTQNTAAELHKKYGKIKAAAETKDKATIAGRIKAIRSFGKLGFADLVDASGKIQISVKEGETEKQSMEIFPLIDLGDFVGVEGKIFKTKKGELTVLAKKITILCKTILPLPEKWHGLKDIETRYRQRYLDMIMNPEVKKVFEKRAKIIDLIREFLKEKGFIETETPLLQPQYGGANAKPFKAYSNALDAELFLSISPELYLKRLVVGGIEKVFTICKSFRNEDIDKTHNPEFTTMECYVAYWDYNDMMKLTEELFEFIAKKMNNSTEIEYQGKKISFKKPWKRLSIIEGLKQKGIDAEKATDNELEALLAKHAPDYDGPKIRGLMIAELFEKLCEEAIVQPTFVIDWPIETTPLCKPHRSKKGLIERFEPMINAWEIGNAYTELNDPKLQRELLEKQAKEGRAKGEQMPVDYDFIKAIEYGMPPLGGLGLGIDRIVMLFTNQPTIKDVIAFPQMRPEKK